MMDDSAYAAYRKGLVDRLWADVARCEGLLLQITSAA